MKSLVVAGCLLGLAVAFVQGDLTLWMYLRVRLALVFLSNLPTPAPVTKPPDMLGINVSLPVAFAVIALPAKSASCMMFWQPFRLWLLGWLPNSRKRQKALRQASGFQHFGFLQCWKRVTWQVCRKVVLAREHLT